jgi:hypothetical protein
VKGESVPSRPSRGLRPPLVGYCSVCAINKGVALPEVRSRSAGSAREMGGSACRNSM